MIGKIIFFIVYVVLALAYLSWAIKNAYKDFCKHGWDWKVFREQDKK
jgi:hypothetical protein